jgi:hypothetical protein
VVCVLCEKADGVARFVFMVVGVSVLSGVSLRSLSLSPSGNGFFRMLSLLPLRLGGGGERPTFSGGKLYTGAEDRVPGTMGRGLDKLAVLLFGFSKSALFFVSGDEKSPRPAESGSLEDGEVGCADCFRLLDDLPDFDDLRLPSRSLSAPCFTGAFAFAPGGSAGTGGASHASGSGLVPMYELATAVPSPLPIVVA